MSQIKNILHEMGLTDTEIDIYLVGLSYETISVKELEKTTRINRTTIYHALDTLTQKGLVSKRESGTGAKLLFTMTSPENIKKFLDREIKLLQEKKKEVDTIIPLLMDRSKQKEEDFTVSHFEGSEGIKLVVEEALYCRSREWSIIAPKKNFFSEFDSNYARYYIKTRKENRIKARSLWEHTPDAQALTLEDVHDRNPRYLPKIMHGKFQSVIIIFDDKVAFISSMKNISAVLIHSREIHETMAAMFSGLWVNAEDVHHVADDH
ncbi:MAG: helix-turn-helix domain-containing protein [Parcubacteria group bacterium]|jgi:sugar-specific transcriptional regulator TrmB